MINHVMRSACMVGILFAGLPATVLAQPDSTAIIAPPTLADWSQRVFSDLDQRLRVRPGTGQIQTSTGIASVKFNCSDSGAPAGVDLYKSSGSRELDQATLRAVREIVTLHPLPAGLGHDQVYIVRVLFANTEEGARRQIAKMQREAAKSNAWYHQNSTKTAAIELVPVG